MKYLISFLLPALIFAGCKTNSSSKDSPTVVAWNVADHYTGSPVEGYRIDIVRQRFSLMGSPEVKIQTIPSDKDGNINGSFYNEEGYLYYVSYSTENTGHGSFLKVNLKTGEKNMLTLKVKKINYVQLTLTDLSKKFKAMSVRFTSKHAPSEQVYSGPCQDTSILFKAVPEEDFTNIHLRLFEVSSGQSSIYDRDTILQPFISRVDTFRVNYSY